MILREAKIEDIPNIVNVLKLSLGEQDLPLSKEIWIFKHLENPFGNSMVFIAEEDNKIIGVRAFMRWKWQLNDKEFESFRAVDTATHPEYQGKGIFKKLTMKAVEEAKLNGDYFIFNTPNDQSRPGYLKMGWEAVNKLKVALKPAYYSFWKINNNNFSYAVSVNCERLAIQNLCTSWNRKLQLNQTLFTPKSESFLKWRYEENPLQKYEVIAREDLYLAVYVKKRKSLKELRISECLYTETSSYKINTLISSLSKKFGAQIISYSPEFLSLGGNLVNANIGPVLTIKNLNLSIQENSKFNKIESWSYSLGDLELF